MAFFRFPVWRFSIPTCFSRTTRVVQHARATHREKSHFLPTPEQHRAARQRFRSFDWLNIYERPGFILYTKRWFFFVNFLPRRTTTEAGRDGPVVFGGRPALQMLLTVTHTHTPVRCARVYASRRYAFERLFFID